MTSPRQTDSNQSSREREAIVAWLRAEVVEHEELAARFKRECDIEGSRTIQKHANLKAHIADAIERGDHLPSPPITQEN